ncbi:hypothetical protein LR48_Vigan03g313000 [Vigna angularis]|uniref:Uncharacterized protein n=2 Tax=Phaseolus angularis TaxID=3914 RepID=A0A0L9UAG4_PHAAN|nr:hypothetical protein LR48_Vigan03g313000 [Vigna angularis]BAT86585.1 hypothetical protein VIGAN_04425600 [Vigna angularis var. angularis]
MPPLPSSITAPLPSPSSCSQKRELFTPKLKPPRSESKTRAGKTPKSIDETLIASPKSKTLNLQEDTRFAQPAAVTITVCFEGHASTIPTLSQ